MFEKQCNFSAVDLEPAFWKTTTFGPVSSPLHLCPCGVFQECLSPVAPPQENFVNSQNQPGVFPHSPSFQSSPFSFTGLKYAFIMPNAVSSDLKLLNISPLLD